MTIVLLHLAINVAVAVAAAGLTYQWLVDMNMFGESPGEIVGWQTFAQVAATAAAGATLILLSTYHGCLDLNGAPKAHVQQATAVLILASWGSAGYLASIALSEGLLFYIFLLPPLKYLTRSYLDDPA